MAFDKNIACLITQTPKDCAVEMAEQLGFPLIITDKIELANAVALSNTILPINLLNPVKEILLNGMAINL